ncbi:MAG: outer membrane lipoprotein-sorting protein [Gammaproteobacteria bacterium]|nr:outer membrane lipoprotein-sorting protein [Gammaproteobacteria bacterium]
MPQNSTLYAFLAPLFIVLCSFTSPVNAEAISAAEIIKRADRVRFPDDGFQVDVAVQSLYPDREPEVFRYRVLSKSNEDTVVMTTYPASERGRIMLMKGSDLWVFLPTVSQPVRLPLSQRLTGQVANGDLARANFAGDYTAEVIGTEDIAGAEHYVLDLLAAKPGVTYHRVKYWVNKENYHPHKAEFYTKSGRLLKLSYYDKYEELGGMIRPVRMRLVDNVKEGEESYMHYKDMVKRNLPDKIFTKSYLKKLN